MKILLLIITAMVIIMSFLSIPVRAEFGIGGGIYYNRQLGDLKDDKDFDKDYVSYMLALKYELMSILGLEANIDYYPGTGNDVIDYTIRPMGTAVVTLPLPVLDLFNFGVGINSTYTAFKKGTGGKNKWSELSYHFKGGIQFPVLDLLWLCGDCYYYVDNLKDIEDFKSDLLTFGARALLRF